jgi:hypothetical protein
MPTDHSRVGLRDNAERLGRGTTYNSVLTQIENVKQLSTSEPAVVSDLHHVHEVTQKQPNDMDAQLALMATDPQIQNELRRIEQEFSHAEADGLETT